MLELRQASNTLGCGNDLQCCNTNVFTRVVIIVIIVIYFSEESDSSYTVLEVELAVLGGHEPVRFNARIRACSKLPS